MPTFPVPGYETGWTADFGECRPLDGSCTRRHQGQDIGAPSGTPIVAMRAGALTFGNQGDSGAGLWAQVSQTLGATSQFYGHMSDQVGAARQVSEGELIGHVGSTGYSSGPHLHFETRAGGVAYDPATALRSASPGSGGGPTAANQQSGIDLPNLPNPVEVIGGAIGAIPNPFDVFQTAADMVSLLRLPIEFTFRGLLWLSDSRNWWRILQVTGGLSVVAMGLLLLARRLVGTAVGAAAAGPAGAMVGFQATGERSDNDDE